MTKGGSWYSRAIQVLVCRLHFFAHIEPGSKSARGINV